MRLRSALAALDGELGIWGDDGMAESWVFNQIHAGEEMRSARHTIAYILTHAGLGVYECHPDWDLAGEDLVVPAEVDGNSVRAREWPMITHAADPAGSPWIGERLHRFDFVEWAMGRASAMLPAYRVFGDALRTRVLEEHSERRVRACPECGEGLVRKACLAGRWSEPAAYLHASRVRVMREDFDRVSSFYREASPALREAGLTAVDFAMRVPECSCPETAGLSPPPSPSAIPERAAARARRLVYVKSRHGVGLDPVVVSSKREIDALRAEGRLAEGL